MRVSAWNDGGRTYGICVGAANRDEYFRRNWSGIEVLLMDASTGSTRRRSLPSREIGSKATR